jgi:hypothetical protein
MEKMDKEAGVSCEHGHFLCAEDLEVLVNHACATDGPKQYTDNEGNLKCPEAKCELLHSLRSLSSFPTAFDTLVQHRVRIGEEKARREVDAHYAVQMQEERKRMEAMTIEEREAYMLKKELEDLLTDRCPCCKVAFVVDDEFKECAALKCQTEGCRAGPLSGVDRGYCAWCLKQFDCKLHEHVGQCPSVSLSVGVADPLFPGAAKLQQHLKQRQKRLILERLNASTPSMKERALGLSPLLRRAVR